MVETEMLTDVKAVVVVMHAWTREVLVITSNRSSVEEWEVLEEDAVVHLQQVVASVLLHPREVLVPHHQVLRYQV